MNALECLADETLLAYQNGTAAATSIEAVAEHLSECPSCLGRLQAVEAADDPLLRALRQQQSLAASPLDPLVAAVISQVLPPDRALAPGTILHEYRLLETLGSGGMGAVYRALHVRLDKEVALKVIHPLRVRDPRLRERFGREMKAIGKLRHPHIVLATDAGEAQGVLYLVMELEQGADLAHYVREQGRLPVAEACAYVQQAALGLQYAHDAGLVHRDVKPSNLFRTAGGQIKLLDLGLALLDVADAPPPEVTETPLEIEAATDSTPLDTHCTLGPMGTDDYMAPEQWNDAHQVDARADLYSLGCTLFYLLTGRPPFSQPGALTRREIREAHLYVAPPALHSLRPDAPPRLEALLNRLLAKKPDDRFASAAEVARELSALSQPKSRRALWTVAAGLALAGAVAIAAMLNLPPEDRGGQTPAGALPEAVTETVPVPVKHAAGPPQTGIVPMTPEVTKQLQTQWAEYLRRPVVFTSSAGIELALVPPGEFQDQSEGRVELPRPFYLGTAEVTMRQFRQFVDDAQYVTDVERNGQGGIIINVNNSRKNLTHPRNTWHSPGFEVESEDCPVVHVTWDDAMAFCAWLTTKEGATCRLQTAAEWTWAARAGKDGVYYATKAEQLAQTEWCSANSENRPRAVRTRSANPWGLFDLNGNVSEWCLDYPDPNRLKRVVDAPIPATGPRRLMAGGAYVSTGASFRTADRSINPHRATTTAGFRVVVEIATDQPKPP